MHFLWKPYACKNKSTHFVYLEVSYAQKSFLAKRAKIVSYNQGI